MAPGGSREDSGSSAVVSTQSDDLMNRNASLSISIAGQGATEAGGRTSIPTAPTRTAVRTATSTAAASRTSARTASTASRTTTTPRRPTATSASTTSTRTPKRTAPSTVSCSSSTTSSSTRRERPPTVAPSYQRDVRAIGRGNNGVPVSTSGNATTVASPPTTLAAGSVRTAEDAVDRPATATTASPVAPLLYWVPVSTVGATLTTATCTSTSVGSPIMTAACASQAGTQLPPSLLPLVHIYRMPSQPTPPIPDPRIEQPTFLGASAPTREETTPISRGLRRRRDPGSSSSEGEGESGGSRSGRRKRRRRRRRVITSSSASEGSPDSAASPIPPPTVLPPQRGTIPAPTQATVPPTRPPPPSATTSRPPRNNTTMNQRGGRRGSRPSAAPAGAGERRARRATENVAIGIRSRNNRTNTPGGNTGQAEAAPQAAPPQRPAPRANRVNNRAIRSDLIAAAGAVATLEDLKRTTDDLSTFLQTFRTGRAAGHTISQPANRQQERQSLNHQGRGRVHEATRIQRLYRENRRRAMREVLSGPSPHCQVRREEVHEYFLKMYSEPCPEEAGSRVAYPWPQRDLDDEGERRLRGDLERPFTAAEVNNRLRRAKNTAPGPDGVTYADLKRADPGSHVLTAIFNACHRLETFPDSWKTSSTVLIHKKGDRNDLSNWRPLALGDTVAKLFAAVMADRLMNFAVKGKRLSRPQKGFLKTEGCHEHNFFLREILEDSRRRGAEVIVTWLDLTNAFGSIPHDVIFDAFRGAQLPSRTNNILVSLNTGCTTRVVTINGSTEPIPVKAGVRQGCPASPGTFNLAAERLIRAIEAAPVGYRLRESLVRSLVYADDIALFASTPEEMRLLLGIAEREAVGAGLKFNPRKCASLHLTGQGRKRVAVPTKFSLHGETIQSMKDGEAYEYLGVPTGNQVSQNPIATIEQMLADIESIDASLLSPWQKMDAVRTFLLPRLDHILRSGEVEKTPLSMFDRLAKQLAKRWMNLPQRASSEVVHVPPRKGGAGLIPLGDLADILTVSHAYRMLFCKDVETAEAAWGSLREAVRRRTVHQPSQEEVARYLSGSLERPFERDAQGDPGLWTRVRLASRRMARRCKVKWREDEATGDLVLDCLGENNAVTTVTPSTSTQVITRLRQAAQESYLASLTAKRDQGKVFQVSARSSVSNAFVRDGKFTRFAEWRFIHRARLDVLPVAGAMRWSDGDKRCRRCGYATETLPHVLCHCLPHSAALQLRHDAILGRIAKACQLGGEVRINQRVQGVDGELATLRPDLVIRDERAKHITIVDVTVTFENQCRAFEDARRSKIAKYAPLAAALNAIGYTTYVEAIVVGALGTWDWENEAVLRRLRVSKHYASLMRRLIVSDTIHWSRDIYVEHVSGVRQYRCPPAHARATPPEDSHDDHP